VLSEMARVTGLKTGQFSFRYDERQWVGAIRKAIKIADTQIYLAMATPEDELLSEAVAIIHKSGLITIAIIIIAIPITWLVARRISIPLRRLAGETDVIRNFDFSEHQPLSDSDYVSCRRTGL